LVTTFLNWPPH